MTATQQALALTLSRTALPPVPNAWRDWRTWAFVVGLLFILGLGGLVRVYPSAAFQGLGFDENLYRLYVDALRRFGLGSYPDLTEGYLAQQAAATEMVLLPPTRFLYIGVAAAWGELFGMKTIAALHAVSCLFSVLTLGVSAVIGWRVAGRAGCLGLTALMAAAPTEIHMAQHALIDGFFAFWALLAVWGLWECLRAPDRAGWQGLYAGALAAMVLTKENAAFVFFALLGLLAACRALRFGAITPRLLLLTVAGPLLGAVGLIFLAGGLGNAVQVYRSVGSKAHVLEYAVRTGDGPWYRYVSDLLLVSPLTLLLAVGGIFRLRRNVADAPAWFALGFVTLSYLPMANVQYAMNLRYATMWNLPLRGLALVGLYHLTGGVAAPSRWRTPLLAGGVAALCLYDLHQYRVFFVNAPLYELVPEGLLRAVRILK